MPKKYGIIWELFPKEGEAWKVKVKIVREINFQTWLLSYCFFFPLMLQLPHSELSLVVKTFFRYIGG